MASASETPGGYKLAPLVASQQGRANQHKPRLLWAILFLGLPVTLGHAVVQPWFYKSFITYFTRQSRLLIRGVGLVQNKRDIIYGLLVLLYCTSNANENVPLFAKYKIVTFLVFILLYGGSMALRLI